MSQRAMFVFFLGFCLLTGPAVGMAEEPAPRKPGLWRRTLQTLRLAPREDAAAVTRETGESPSRTPAPGPAQPTSEAEQKRGILRRTMETLRLAPRQGQTQGQGTGVRTAGGSGTSASANVGGSIRTVRVKDLILRLELSPMPVVLSETRQLRVSLTATNRSNRYVHLDFPTTQRIDVLVRDAQGRTVTQWSEDQAFSNEPSTLTINPGERVEYNASISTRDMRAGQPCTVEVIFPNHDRLRVQQTFVPQT